MSFAKAYLEKVSLDPVINSTDPSPNLFVVIAIPACNEPGLLDTLQALQDCNLPDKNCEIIVALNSSESASPDVIRQNLDSSSQIRARNGAACKIPVLHLNRTGIPGKTAGAGFARKLAMDHALSRFDKLDRPDGIILSLDADTLCEPNYIKAVEEHFILNPKSKACSIRFEHPLEGSKYPGPVYRGITLYELHLRYYIEGLRFAGHPHAFHTVGSAFAIRAGVYSSQGGMNRRTAGEDFYFLQKIIPLGNFHELNDTCLHPSPRPSLRVAFGTGRTVSRFLAGEITSMESYNPKVFYDLREFISSVPRLYGDSDPQTVFGSLPASVQANTGDEFHSRLKEIRDNSSRYPTFRKRFFRWFNMFRTLKYINSAHRDFYPKLQVGSAALEFLARTGHETGKLRTSGEALLYLRRIQKDSNWQDSSA
jgi:hypothetical protein